MQTAVITGAASGIGKATANLLRSRGYRVIGVDRRESDVVADLSGPAGRNSMIEQVSRLCPDGIDAVVAAAGIALVPDPRATLAVNFFGAVRTLEGLRPLLARSDRPRAVTITSTAIMLAPNEDLVRRLLAGDEQAALASLEVDENVAYSTSKMALARWVRQAAVSREWAGSGILLNAVAPGVTATPMTVPVRATAEAREALAKSTPNAVGRYAEAEEIAEVVAFLAGLQGGYLLGQNIFVDGGTDAIVRPGLI